MAERFSVIAKNGMVASSQPLATLAGVQILANGGNAIDAAVATAAVLGVVEPSSIGVGSDAFCLFYSAKEKKIKALDASGRSPYAASVEFCRRSGFTEMPQRGIHSVTVPGAVHGWATLLNFFGKKKLDDVLQSAIGYAEEGFPVAELTAEQWKESEARLKADSGADELSDRWPSAQSRRDFQKSAHGGGAELHCGGRAGLFLPRRDRQKTRSVFRTARRSFHASRFRRAPLRLGRADHRVLSRL
jgi:gamma-glutamyltranspeptidase